MHTPSRLNAGSSGFSISKRGSSWKTGKIKRTGNIEKAEPCAFSKWKTGCQAFLSKETFCTWKRSMTKVRFLAEVLPARESYLAGPSPPGKGKRDKKIWTHGAFRMSEVGRWKEGAISQLCKGRQRPSEGKGSGNTSPSRLRCRLRPTTAGDRLRMLASSDRGSCATTQPGLPVPFLTSWISVKMIEETTRSILGWMRSCIEKASPRESLGRKDGLVSFLQRDGRYCFGRLFRVYRDLAGPQICSFAPG